MPHTLIHGSAHSLPEIADKSIHLICTSPPYYGLRAYAGDQGIEWPTVEYSPMAGLAPIRVQGCEPGCVHEWADGPVVSQQPQRNGPGGQWTNDRDAPSRRGSAFKTTQGAYCIHCGGWRGGLGLEPAIEMYIGHLILCLREWHRILRDDGLIFCNLGDSYNGSGGYSPNSPANQNGSLQSQGNIKGERNRVGRNNIAGLKPKDLMMIPARFALAAQADGWYLRSAIVWAKGVSFIPHYAGSCMPESVTDRPTQSYEMVYMLAKSPTYYYDAEAVKEQSLQPTGVAEFTAQHKQIALRDRNGLNHSTLGANQGSTTRNLRSVWAISPRGYSGAHFACWPMALVEPMIKSGTSAHGVCGAPVKKLKVRDDLTPAEREKVNSFLVAKGWI